MQGNVLTPPAEGPYPMYTGAPPDRRPRTLRDALAEVKALIMADRAFTPDEQAEFSTFVQEMIAFAQMRAGAGPEPTAGMGEQPTEQDYNPMGDAGGQDAAEYSM
jgi:hypothetical protein